MKLKIQKTTKDDFVGKGLFAQLQKLPMSGKPLSNKKLNKMIDEYHKKAQKEYIRKQKVIKQNIKDLKKREIELGESAPVYLWYCVSTVETIYISAGQYKAWKKWF